MNLKPGILLVALSLLIASCNMRYGHVPKVKSGKKYSSGERPKPSPKQASVFLEQKKDIILPVTVSAPEIKPLPIKQKRQATRIDIDTPRRLLNADSTIATTQSPLKKEDMKLNDTNFRPVFNLVLIILIIALMLFLSGLFTAALFDIVFITILDIEATLLLLLLAATIIIDYLLFSWLKNRIEKYKKIKINYNGTQYTEGDINQMDSEVRSRHSFNNLLAALILLVISLPFLILPPLVIFTFLFLVAANYFFIKAVLTR